MSKSQANKLYIPKRNDIIWLDFDPTKGKEIGKYRPALVLSSQEYNRKSSLLICCPISTSARGGTTEVPIDGIESGKFVVAANLIQTSSWKDRRVKFIAEAEPGVMDEVLLRILPLIGAEKVIKKLIEK